MIDAKEAVVWINEERKEVVLHIEDSGATATTNFRLTSFPMLRTRSPVCNGLLMVTSGRGMVLSLGLAALT